MNPKSNMHSLIAKLSLLAFVAWAGDENTANPLLQRLVDQGIEIAAKGETFKLPEPSLPAGVSGQQQKQIIERLVSKKYSYDQFVRKSPVAPFLLEMQSREAPPGNAASDAGRVQRLDLWFVAYGSVQMVSDRQLLSQLAVGNSSSHGQFETLTDDELSKRELSARNEDDFKESYSRIELPVLDKVQVRGIVHAATTHGRGSAVAAALLDPALTDDAEYPTRWRSILKRESGEAALGKPHAYTGLAAYCRVMELRAPKGAMFIECHLVFGEPHGWFHGTNLLRSKLPLVVQDSVRNFRRKLADVK